MRFPPLPCPHPDCPVSLRMVPNMHTMTVTIYHGEDVLFSIADFDKAAQLPELSEQFLPIVIASVVGLHAVQEVAHG